MPKRNADIKYGDYMQNELYKNGYWYENTYNSLGAGWLLDSISKLNLDYGFRLANFSANAGYYEDDVYEMLKEEKNPYFYVGDMLANELKNKKKESHANFVYLEGERDANEVSVSLIEGKRVDILVDCKGALWYASQRKDFCKAKLVKLLNVYKTILKDDGVLLIDYHGNSCVSMRTDSYIFKLNMNKRLLKKFGEPSTKKHLQNILGWRFVNKYCHVVNINPDDRYPLSKYMRTAYIKAEDIDKAIDILNRRY